jgi:hypothetical protein
MDSNRQLELLYDSLKHEYTTYIDGVLKSAGFMLLALGWLLTSESARTALRSSRTITLLCVMVLLLNIAGMVIGHYIRSRRIQMNLRRLAPEMEPLIRNYSIVASHILVNALALIPLFVILVLMVW